MASAGKDLPRASAKLDVENYMAWSHEMEYLLRFQGLWGLVVPVDHPEAECQIPSAGTDGIRLRSGLQLGASVGTGTLGGTSRGDAVVKSETTTDDTATTPEEEALLLVRAADEQRTRAERARVILMLNVRAHHSAKLRRQMTARDLWASLREEFHPRKRSREVTLRRQLNSLAMGSNDTPTRYFNRAWDLVSLLQDIGIVVDDGWLLGALLSGLSDKYERTVESMEEREDITVRKALAMLHAADARAERRALRKKTEKVGGAALVADGEDEARSRRERYRETRCHKCRKTGHIQRFCPTRKGKNKGKAKATGPPPGYSPSSSESEEEVGTAGLARLTLESDEDEAGYAMLARLSPLPADADGDVTWAVDSGASHHMCGSPAALTDVHPGRPVTITLANGDTTRATTRGTAVLRVNGTRLMLRDVLVVPRMAMPLFSVRTASRAGYTTEFTDSGVRVHKDGTTIVRGTTSGGIYVLRGRLVAPRIGQALAAVGGAEDAAAETPVTEERGSPRQGAAPAPAAATASPPTPVGVDPKAALWHRRYGHLSADGLRRTMAAVNGMDLTRSSLATLKGSTCEPCIVSKMVRAPYVASDREPERVLEYVHSDVIGPMPVPTAKGRRYLMGAVDDYSRYKEVVPIHEKGHAKDALMRVLNRWENVTGHRVGTLRTDDGKEYQGQAFDAWLGAKGIKHEKSAPYAHQHNGVAERFNRTVQERMMAALTDARLDHMFWGEAATSVTRALNCTPQRGHTLTPYEMFYGHRPDVSSMRVFGCRAWAYVPPDIRRKMDPRALPATHLGCAEASKGYRVLINGRVYIRRDVTFDELTRGSGGRWDAPATMGPQTEVAGLTGETHSPIEEAIFAARRLVGATNPTETDDGEDSESAESTTSDDTASAPSQTTVEEEEPIEHAALDEEPLVENRAPDGEPEPPRRSRRLAERNPAASPHQGAMGLRAWALAAGGRGGPDKLRVYEARNEADWPDFDAANKVEVQALWDNGTWEMVPLPAGKKVIRTELLCERKRGPAGEIAKYKGRLVVRGDTQVPYVDYTETWAPVARYTTLRYLLGLCTRNDLALLQLDVATAFLNGEVAEEIYINEPRGYERGPPGLVCRLRKALYGLKQAARAWYHKLRATLERAGFVACEADECLFKRGTVGKDVCYILVYVDDLLIAARTMRHAEAGQAVMTTAFKCKTMGAPTYFLGLHIDRDVEGQTLRLHQRQYVTTLLTRFGLVQANPVLLPMGAGVHLTKQGTPLDAALTKVYQELVGALLYLSTSTRPDIAYAVGRLTRFVAAPTAEHLAAGKVVLRYLKGTATFGLCYTSKGELHGYCDADFAADRDTRRSTSAMVYLFGGAAIAWGSKLQPSVAASTTEAEYIAAAGAAKEGMWLRRVREFLTTLTGSVPLWSDSQSALALMHNPVTSARTKHIDVCHHLVRERVADGTLSVHFVGTVDQTADILTKPLGTVAFGRCALGLGMSADAQGAPRGGVLELTPAETGVHNNVPPPPDGTGLPSGMQHRQDSPPARSQD